MNAQHTPTPWSIKNGAEIFSSTGACVCVVSVHGESFEQDEATTQFIVRAVNAHDALVEALRDLLVAASSDNPHAVSITKRKVHAALRLAEGGQS